MALDFFPPEMKRAKTQCFNESLFLDVSFITYVFIWINKINEHEEFILLHIFETITF